MSPNNIGSKYLDSNTLMYAFESGIISRVDILKQVEDMKNKDYLNEHKYSIWEGEKDKKWYTYLPDETRPRKKKLIKRTTKDAIEKEVIKYYKQKENENKISTFKDAYFLWREKHDGTVSVNSVAKYDSDYKRYFKGTEFEEIYLKNMMDDNINTFMVQTVKSKKLKREATQKLFANIKDVLFTARKYGAMVHNPVEFIKVKEFYKDCVEDCKSDKDKIFSDEEIKLLLEQIEKDHAKKPYYIPVYAIEMAILTGMRAGELPALRWDRITDNCIWIDSSEKSNPKKTEFYIGKTKTGKPRPFPIDDEIRKLLDTIKAVQKEYGYESEYVFANEKGRIHSRQMHECLKTKCRQVKIKARGITALRKTFNSALRCNGVSAVVAAQLLGHTVETNNKYYTFDNTNMEQKNKIVSDVNSRLKVTRGNTLSKVSNI